MFHELFDRDRPWSEYTKVPSISSFVLFSNLLNFLQNARSLLRRFRPTYREQGVKRDRRTSDARTIYSTELTAAEEHLGKILGGSPVIVVSQYLRLCSWKYEMGRKGAAAWPVGDHSDSSRGSCGGRYVPKTQNQKFSPPANVGRKCGRRRGIRLKRAVLRSHLGSTNSGPFEALYLSLLRDLRRHGYLSIFLA